MGKRKYPAWYYESTSPEGQWDEHPESLFPYPGLPKKLRGLIYLLRNNGWNTTASGTSYKGVIVIRPYSEQFGHHQEHGGATQYLRNFLWKHGYKHFEIKRTQFSWHGKLVDDLLVLKLLGPGYMERTK